MNSTITPEKLHQYFTITKEALDKAKVAFNPNQLAQAQDFYMMAESYYNDAQFFYKEKKDAVLAFAALNYAHGWLDAGARSGLLQVKDSRLFTVDDQ
mgnify:CR=1 FL=1